MGRDRAARWAILALAVAVQLIVLYSPRAVSTPPGLPVDKLVHIAIFGFVAWAGVRAGIPLGWVVGVLLAHAVISEIVQAWMLPNRSGDPWDAVADTVGTLLGAWLGRQAMMRA